MSTKKKKPTRADRWFEAAMQAEDALQELLDMQSEFESWRDNLPESLQSSPVGEKLDMVCDIDIQSALDAAGEAKDADLPLGFGRD